MPTITNHLVSQVNVVIIPSTPLDFGVISIDRIKTKLAETYSDSKPVLTQFPDLMLIFDSNNQISITILKDNNRVIVADNKITPFTDRELENFLRFVKDTMDIINNNNIKNYGFNILSVFDIDQEGFDSGAFIRDQFMRNSAKAEILQNVQSVGVNIVYRDGEIRYDLRLEPRFGPNLESSKSISANLNVHFNGSLESLTELNTKLRNIYDGFSANLTRLME